MKKRLLVLLLLSQAILLGLIWHINYLSNKTFEQTIDNKLHNITHPKDSKTLLSSNPYDYIKNKDVSNDYKYIVSKGKKSLNYMLKKFASNNADGFEEYIMAIACSEILKEDKNLKKWSTGREWYNNYKSKLY